jgi:hypothetical protein
MHNWENILLNVNCSWQHVKLRWVCDHCLCHDEPTDISKMLAELRAEQ